MGKYNIDLFLESYKCLSFQDTYLGPNTEHKMRQMMAFERKQFVKLGMA